MENLLQLTSTGSKELSAPLFITCLMTEAFSLLLHHLLDGCCQDFRYNPRLWLYIAIGDRVLGDELFTCLFFGWRYLGKIIITIIKKIYMGITCQYGLRMQY